jgi:hypothetical protein
MSRRKAFGKIPKHHPTERGFLERSLKEKRKIAIKTMLATRRGASVNLIGEGDSSAPPIWRNTAVGTAYVRPPITIPASQSKRSRRVTPIPYPEIDCLSNHVPNFIATSNPIADATPRNPMSNTAILPLLRVERSNKLRRLNSMTVTARSCTAKPTNQGKIPLQVARTRLSSCPLIRWCILALNVRWYLLIR